VLLSAVQITDRKHKHLITEFSQSVQTTLIDKVSNMFQDSEKSEASIWFSLYEPATINIIGGNLHFLCTNSGSIVESP